MSIFPCARCGWMDPDCKCVRGDIPTRRARAAVSRRHREAMARAGKRHTGKRAA